MTADLPAALRQAAAALLEGMSRKGLAERAAKVSAEYRRGGASAAVIEGQDDATAYVLSRLPATYAAAAWVFAEAARRAPGFAPARLLDAGAGPGGASWAALETWPGLRGVALLDSSRPFLEMAARLGVAGPPALQAAVQLRADLSRPDGAWPRADLVVASYALAEIAPPRQPAAVQALWDVCDGVLALVEPGTPAGFARIVAARQALIAAGADLLAPCPHAGDCPLAGPQAAAFAPPGWCHFSVRLPRSRDHRLAKGAQVPFEDEKFAYLLAARPGLAAGAAPARVLAPPKVAKPGLELALCGPQGLARRMVLKRDKGAYAAHRRLRWGDAAPD